MSSSAFCSWTPAGRAIVFTLAATSIWCLLSEFYGLCSMQTFVIWIFIPATIALVAMAFWDRLRGDGLLWRAIMIGALAGLAAAVAYDIFRLPFVFSRQWHLSAIVPPMNLFKVFPRFGAMVLGEPLEQAQYTLTTHLVGWAYHFSNGLTFGIMYVALIGAADRRSWLWAAVMAVGLELAMLLTPYPRFFGITVTAAFIMATLTAHLIFGVAMGLLTKGAWARWPAAIPS